MSKQPIDHLWKVFWIVDGVVRETLPPTGRCVPRGVAYAIRQIAAKTTHRTGTLEVVPDYESPQDRHQMPIEFALDTLNKIQKL